MGKKIDVRVSDYEREIAEKLADEMGLKISELIRFLLDSFDPSMEQPRKTMFVDKNGRKIEGKEYPPFGISILALQAEKLKDSDKKFKEEADLMGELKYCNYLISNIANNTNQIAHYLNKYGRSGQVNFEAVKNSLADLKNQSDNASRRIKNHFKFK